MCSSDLVCLYVILLPYIDDILVLFMGMYGKRVSTVHVPHGMNFYPVLHGTCCRCGIGSPMFISVEFYTFEGADYAPIMLSMEEQFLMYWLGEHLIHDESLILDGAINGEGEDLQLSPYQLPEDKQHFGGEDYNVPT